MKKKLYVGCALTTLPPEKRESFLALVKEVKMKLSGTFEILEFLGVTDGGRFSAREVYQRDIQDCVMKADIMLALCDYPALGLGYEIATAVEKRGIPVIAMAAQDATVTRLIKGIEHPHFSFEHYSSVDDIVNRVLKLA